MQFLSGDTHLSAKAKLSPVSEPCGRVDHDHCGINLSQETIGVTHIVGQNRFRVLGRVGGYVAERFIE
jgi:hypothetical protein